MQIILYSIQFNLSQENCIMLKKITTAIIISITTANSFADINTGGAYLGAGLGYGNNSMVEKVFAGYMVSKYWGLETDYTFWGSDNSSIGAYNVNYTKSPQTLDGLLVLNVPLGGLSLAAHAKLGVSYVWLNTSSSADYTPSGNALTSAAGLGLSLTPWKHFELSIDWMTYGFIQPVGITVANNNSAATWSGNNYTLNLGYHF